MRAILRIRNRFVLCVACLYMLYDIFLLFWVQPAISSHMLYCTGCVDTGVFACVLGNTVIIMRG